MTLGRGHIADFEQKMRCFLHIWTEKVAKNGYFFMSKIQFLNAFSRPSESENWWDEDIEMMAKLTAKWGGLPTILTKKACLSDGFPLWKTRVRTAVGSLEGLKRVSLDHKLDLVIVRTAVGSLEGLKLNLHFYHPFI